MTRCSQSESGFTLVELMVALAIFALISVAGVTLLRSGTDTQLAVKERLEGLSRASRLYNALEGDLAQAVARPVRDSGGSPLPAFTQGGTATTGELFSFVRAGWSNFDNSPRAGLQHIVYLLQARQLKRQTWPMLDGAAPTDAATLVDDVSDVQLRFRDDKGEWRDDWTAADPMAMPRAVEMRLTVDGRPEHRMLFLVGPQTRLPPPSLGDEAAG